MGHGTIAAMNDVPLPRCCNQLRQHWPFSLALPGACLISSHFDPSLLLPGDFAASGIAPVRGVAKRQAEYLAGRLCAREALRRVTGVASVPAVGADRAPQWPAEVSGSITHGQGWAAAIVARKECCLGLGLDVEQCLASPRAESLAAEILTENELQRLTGLAPQERAWRISLTFSLKESLFKALYPLVLKHFYFHDAELLSFEPQQGSAVLRLLLDLSQDWPAGTELRGHYAMLDKQLLSLVSISR